MCACLTIDLDLTDACSTSLMCAVAAAADDDEHGIYWEHANTPYCYRLFFTVNFLTDERMGAKETHTLSLSTFFVGKAPLILGMPIVCRSLIKCIQNFSKWTIYLRTNAHDFLLLVIVNCNAFWSYWSLHQMHRISYVCFFFALKWCMDWETMCSATWIHCECTCLQHARTHSQIHKDNNNKYTNTYLFY